MATHTNCYYVGIEQLWASLSSSFQSIVFSIVLYHSFFQLGYTKKKGEKTLCVEDNKSWKYEFPESFVQFHDDNTCQLYMSGITRWNTRGNTQNWSSLNKKIKKVCQHQRKNYIPVTIHILFVNIREGTRTAMKNTTS